MISNDHVSLRPVRDSELEQLYALDNQLDQRGTFAGITIDSFVEYRRDYEKYGWWFDDAKGGGLVLCDASGEIVGSVGCRRNGIVEGYEIGYQIYEVSNRGKGLMTHGLRLFSAYMFSWKPIQRLYLFIIPENTASIRVADRVGYVYEGTMRRATFVRGRYYDFAIYSMLRDEAPAFAADR